MQCNELQPESYGLYALGLLDNPDRDELREHLGRACPTCSAAFREHLGLWWMFAGSAVTLVQPPARLRRRILSAIEGERLAASAWWKPLAAALCTGVVAFWLGGLTGQRPAPVQVVVKPDEAQTAQIQQLTEENRKLRASIDAPHPVETPEPPRVVPAPKPDERLMQELAQAKSAAEASALALDQERARATKLESEIAQQKTTLAEAEKRRLEAENLYRAALVDRRQVAEYAARIKDLERDVAQYKAVLSRQERTLQQSLRTASLLSSPSLRFVQLRGTGKTPRAVGHAFVAEGSRVVFYASNLPALPQGRVYQLWLIRGRGPAIVSGGVFAPDAQSRSVVEFEDASIVTNIRGLAVTDEPAGGSPLPTGNKFLVGS